MNNNSLFCYSKNRKQFLNGKVWRYNNGNYEPVKMFTKCWWCILWRQLTGKCD